MDNFIARKNRGRILPQLTKEEIWASDNYFEPEVVLNRIQPDIAIYCNVNTFRTISRFAKEIIHILDFYGPVQLEGLFLSADEPDAMQDPHILEAFCREMVQKLRDIDYVITVSERQKYFWSAYCTLAGFRLSDVNVIVCPAAFQAPSVTRNPAPFPTVVYSGGFYPWQKPDRALTNAAAILEDIEGATLHIFGGAHAGMPNEEHVSRLLAGLQEFRCVKYHGYRPVEELMATLSTAWCALELMEQNLERELAVTGRTLEFLSSGTPVIYNNYATLSKLIEQYGAGWTLPSSDRSALCPVFEELKSQGVDLVNKLSSNAQRLAACEFSAERSMLPLAELCEGALKKRPRAVSPSSIRHVPAQPGRASLGRVLAISPGAGALRELRVNNPLRALQRQGHIDGMRVVDAFFHELRNDPNQYEVILIQRAVPEFIFETLHNLGLPFVLECDDNILARAAYRTAEPEADMIAGLRYCSILTAPNPRLVRKLEKYSGVGLTGKAFILPNALPFPENARLKPGSAPSQILWIQSDIAALSNSREAVVRAVDDFSTKYSLPIVLIGPRVLSNREFRRQIFMGEIDFSSNLQLLEFTPVSVGVAPLETDADEETLDFVAGKSDLKMLLFAGYGHAGVYSSAPPYTDSPLQDGLGVVENTYEAWMAALEYQYREGWRDVPRISERIQRERHIDAVARESWQPALRTCVLPRPIRGADLYDALQAARQVDATPARSIAYLMGNWDVARGYVAYGNTGWEHYCTYGRSQDRRGRYVPDAHKEFLDRITRESAECVARAQSKLETRQRLLESMRDKNRKEQDASRDEIRALQSEIGRLEGELAIAHRTLVGMENSRSWKMTGPLRKAAGLLNKH